MGMEDGSGLWLQLTYVLRPRVIPRPEISETDGADIPSWD